MEEIHKNLYLVKIPSEESCPLMKALTHKTASKCAYEKTSLVIFVKKNLYQFLIDQIKKRDQVNFLGVHLVIKSILRFFT